MAYKSLSTWHAPLLLSSALWTQLIIDGWGQQRQGTYPGAPCYLQHSLRRERAWLGICTCTHIIYLSVLWTHHLVELQQVSFQPLSFDPLVHYIIIENDQDRESKIFTSQHPTQHVRAEALISSRLTYTALAHLVLEQISLMSSTVRLATS